VSRRKIDIRQQLFGFPDEDLKTSLHDEIVLWLKRNASSIAKQIVNWKSTWPEQVLRSSEQRAREMVAKRIDLLRTALPLEEKRLEQLANKETRFPYERDLPTQVAAKKSELDFLQLWNGLGEPPAPDFAVVSEMERPIQRQRYQTTDIIGYADLVVWARATTISAGYISNDEYGRPRLGVDPKAYASWKIEWRDIGTFAFDAKSEIRSLGELIRQFKTYRVYSKLPFYVVSPDAHFSNEVSEEGFGFIKYPDGKITLPKGPVPQ